jgi:hypothetical protein
MTPDNFQVVLRMFLKPKPFRPFTLELFNGSRLEVTHPEALTLYKELVVFNSTTGIHSVLEYAAVVRFIDGTGG